MVKFPGKLIWNWSSIRVTLFCVYYRRWDWWRIRVILYCICFRLWDWWRIRVTVFCYRPWDWWRIRVNVLWFLQTMWLVKNQRDYLLYLLQAVGLVENQSDWYLGKIWKNHRPWPALVSERKMFKSSKCSSTCIYMFFPKMYHFFRYIGHAEM